MPRIRWILRRIVEVGARIYRVHRKRGYRPLTMGLRLASFLHAQASMSLPQKCFALPVAR